MQKKVKKDENASYFGECVFDVHLNENFRNIRESFFMVFWLGKCVVLFMKIYLGRMRIHFTFCVRV